MKNMLIAFVAALIALVIILIGFTIHGRALRQIELDNALKSSMEDAMTSLLYEEGRPQTEEEWKASFLQSLVEQINSASDLKVVFIEADWDKGILSAEATLTWKHPIGTTGSVSRSMTIILEEYVEIVGAGTLKEDSITQYSSSPDSKREVDEIYYFTDRQIVLEDAFNTNFEVRVLEDGTGKNKIYKNVSNYYIPKGTWIITAKDKWHEIKYDTLTIKKVANTNNQLLTMKCDTRGVTPYLRVNKFSSRPGYTLKDFATERNNKDSTESSANGTITTSVPTDEVLSTDENFDVYIGAKSSLSKIKFIWEPNNYKVKYNANGGSGSMSHSSHTYDAPKSLTANSFTRTGYTFAGWNTKADGSGTPYKDKESVENLTTKAEDTVNLYAQWAPITYTIKYDANGGRGTMPDKICTYGKTETLLTNQFSRTRHIFIGWNTEADGTGTSYKNKKIIKNLTSTANKTITLYAQWEETVTYNLTIDPNGGTYEGSTSEYVYQYLSENRDVYISEPIRDGYTLMRWDRSNSRYFVDLLRGYNDTLDYNLIPLDADTANELFSISDDSSVISRNSISDYTNYKFEGNSSSIAIPYASLCQIGGAEAGYTINISGYIKSDLDTASICLRTDTGIGLFSVARLPYVNNIPGEWQYFSYSFTVMAATSKYGDGLDLAITPSINLQEIEDINGCNIDMKGLKVTRKWSGFESGIQDTTIVTMNDCDATLTAQWKPNKYTVEYDGNGSTGGSTTASTHTYDEAKNLTTNNFVRTDYIFTGWNTKADGTGTNYKDEEEVINLTNVKDGTVTLYAQWSDQNYTIRYDANGGTGIMEDTTPCVYTKTYVLTANAFVRLGYNFTGWNTKADGTGTNYGDQASVSKLTSTKNGTVILYAQWKPITYTVVYDAGGGTGTMMSSTHTYDEYKPLNANTFTKTGFTFLEWLGSTEEQSFSFSDHESIINLTTEDGAIITLYANWIGKKTTTTFYRNISRSDTLFEKNIFIYDVKNQFFPDLNVEWKREGYTLAGWSEDKNAETVTYDTSYVVTSEYIESNYPSNELYAKWDKHPEITAPNRYFTLEQAQNGEITEEVLLAKVKAVDLEDGVLVNGVSVTVKNYNASDFTSLTVGQNVEITYQAVDSLGNVVTQKAISTIVDVGMKESPTKRYVRFISPQFYTDSNGEPITESQGGLEETSIWRAEPEYSNLLQNTLSALKINVETKTISAFGKEWDVEVAGSGDWTPKEETWIFDQMDIKNLKDYTNTYGYVANAIDKFFELFKSCRQE